jgi:hypothetical protein
VTRRTVDGESVPATSIRSRWFGAVAIGLLRDRYGGAQPARTPAAAPALAQPNDH